MKKRRATVIYENENGILLTRISSEPWLLPGGHAEYNEPRIIAAIRELKEETGLKARDVKFLFEFESGHYYQKVFHITADGEPSPNSEVANLIYYYPGGPLAESEISYSSMDIIRRYLEMKTSL